MTLNIVRIQHQGVSRRFLLVDDVEQLEDIVRMEFAIHPEEHVALATPFAGDKQDVVIVPFHSQQLRLIKESHPSATFDLRVYPALDKSLSMQFTATNSRPVDNSVVLGVNQVIAQYDFNASSIREISFSAGDVIEVIGQYNGDWFRGRIGDQEGYFPANYVEGIERLNHNLFESIDESGGDWQDVEYFNSYANLTIHLEMLQDKHRTMTYKSAIESVKDIEDKIVMDIGCGSGILSIFCALAGAKHVYAVDASDVIQVAEKTIKENGLQDKITLIRGKVEDIKLPVDKVDMIVSEWMGTMLICESMISSVLNARKLFLSENGLMAPSTSDLFLVPLNLPDLYEKKIGYWDDVYGVKMSCLKQRAHKEFFSNPLFDRLIKPEDMMCEAVKVFHLDMHHDSAEVLERIVSPFHFKLKKSGVIHGFGTWFDSGFRSSRSEEDSIVLTTSPFGESTHWRNVTFVLEEQVSLQSGDEISGEFIISRNPQWLRHFDVKISFEVLGSGLKVSQSMPVWR